MELTILMPCLNEAQSLPLCLEKASAFLKRTGIEGEIIVADNGSTDGSREIAAAAGARVVEVEDRGYGAALSEGIYEARGTFVIMGDSDNSYDFLHLDGFVEQLRAGYDLVMGNRFAGGIKPGAMPLTHRYFGNPVLSFLGRRIYHHQVCRDFYCGLRGFRRDAIESLNLQSRGMEFALEMVIKSQLYGLRLTEVPTTLSPDDRGRPPHLRTLHDGWRSLRLYLLMSPRWTFGIPGGIVLLSGIILLGSSFLRLIPESAVVPILAIGSASCILGYQSFLLAIFAKFIAIETGLHPPATLFKSLQDSGTVERLLIIGVPATLISGAYGLAVALGMFYPEEYGTVTVLNSVSLATTLFILGGQTILGGFYLGILHLVAERRKYRRKRRSDERPPPSENGTGIDGDLRSN